MLKTAYYIIMFSKFFTTYIAATPPPIKTEEQLEIENKFKRDEGHIINLDSHIPDNNFSLGSAPLYYQGVKDIPKQQPFINFGFNSIYEEYNPNKYTEPSNIALKAVEIARSKIGSNYSYGGGGQNEFDCSELIQYSYKQAGLEGVPRISHQQGNFGTQVNSLSQAQIGDVIYTKGRGPSGGHVQMISRIDDDGTVYTIEAKGKRYGVVESEFKGTPLKIRRFVNPDSNRSYNKNNKNRFINDLKGPLETALRKNGIDPTTWLPTLLAQTAYESGWGNNFSRSINNFGGIKGKGAFAQTREGNKGQYVETHSFAKFNSIQEFADRYVEMLKNRFNAFNGPVSTFTDRIKSKGYFTLALNTYKSQINNIIKSVTNLL